MELVRCSAPARSLRRLLWRTQDCAHDAAKCQCSKLQDKLVTKQVGEGQGEGRTTFPWATHDSCSFSYLGRHTFRQQTLHLPIFCRECRRSRKVCAGVFLVLLAGKACFGLCGQCLLKSQKRGRVTQYDFQWLGTGSQGYLFIWNIYKLLDVKTNTIVVYDHKNRLNGSQKVIRYCP